MLEDYESQCPINVTLCDWPCRVRFLKSQKAAAYADLFVNFEGVKGEAAKHDPSGPTIDGPNQIAKDFHY